MHFIKYIKRNENVCSPIRVTDGSIGLDLFPLTNATLQPHEVRILDTGLTFIIPDGYYIRLASKSSLASKGLVIEGGVVDPDYKGETKVIVHNISTKPKVITKDKPIAQAIVTAALIVTPVAITREDLTSERFDKYNRLNKAFGQASNAFFAARVTNNSNSGDGDCKD